MKRWSIKAKLTALYAGFMVLLTCAALAILFSLSSQEVLSSVQVNLKKQVQESLEDLEGNGGRLRVDSDFYAMENSVYLSVYSMDGTFLYGRVPAGFSGQPEFQNDMLQTVRDGAERFYVFDLFHQVKGYGQVYVRGIVSVTRAENSFSVTIRFALILLPGLALLMIFISYRFIRRALLPVRKVTDTVREIRYKKNLSSRVGLPRGQDEVYQLAETFDQMLEELEMAFRREQQFTSDVSHELRTPIAVVLLQCEELYKDPVLSDTQREKVAAIHKKAREMAAMVSNLLLLSRADQGRAVLQKEELNISELTELTAEEQQGLADQKNIRIITAIEPDIRMQADESFFIRLLSNLITNSISYGKENGKTEISLRREQGQIVLQVADNGIGIAEDVMPHIWERFYRADTSRSDSSHSGLGLSMVQWIVSEHGGTIEAESTEGVGSVFTCRFPEKTE